MWAVSRRGSELWSVVLLFMPLRAFPTAGGRISRTHAPVRRLHVRRLLDEPHLRTASWAFGLLRLIGHGSVDRMSADLVRNHD